MDHLYARLKRLQKDPYRKVISGERIFDETVPSPSSCHEYDPHTVLDADEWFKLSNFSQKPYFPDELSAWASSANFSELKKPEFQNITYLLAIQERNFHFQRVRPSAILRKKVVVCGDVAKIERPSEKIVLNLFPDAVYFVEDDALVFRELAAISPVFRGIDELFTEATDSQVKEFLDQEFLHADIKVSKVSKPNRKRIALAVETLGKMSDAERMDVFSYISKYTDSKISFNDSEQIFRVSSDEELKLLLYGIEQRFYTTTVGSEDRIANSVVKFKP